MINFAYENFSNFGFIKAVLTEDQIKPIKDEIDLIKIDSSKSKKYNSRLAGNIKEEYELVNCFSYVESLLLPLAQSYLNVNKYIDYIKNNFKLFSAKQDIPFMIELETLWVNFQNKYEFNPIHNHTSVISFVIWIDIPFSNDDELKQDHVKNSNSPSAGEFNFLYLDIFGDIRTHSIRADKKYNHGLLLFPAKLSHLVYPFYTSDKQRISVAGNFKLVFLE